MKRTNQKGFTVIELVIILVIIVVLAAILIPAVANVIRDAKDSADLAKAHSTIIEYSAKTDVAPTDGFIYDCGNGKVVAYKDGAQIKNGTKDFFADVDTALKQFVITPDDPETTDKDETVYCVKQDATYTDAEETKKVENLYIVVAP